VTDPDERIAQIIPAAHGWLARIGRDLCSACLCDWGEFRPVERKPMYEEPGAEAGRQIEMFAAQGGARG
jgi:hypothetical protein